MSVKDRVLLESAPHLVLDGAVAAATAVGADTIVVAIPHARVHAHAAVDAALEQRDDRPRIRVAGVPDAFLSGEETALVAALEGRAPKPTLTPPRPSERGLKRRPTLVQNTETLAHIALIARHGPGWFRALGPADHPGSTLVSLDGCVAAPGVHEIAVGHARGRPPGACRRADRAGARRPARRLPRHLGRRGPRGVAAPGGRPARAPAPDLRRGRRRRPAPVGAARWPRCRAS